MRVYMVCGSLGRVSANRSALSVAASALIALGAEVDDDDALGSIPPLAPDLVDAPGAAVADFRRRIADADAVVIAAPEYAGSLGGAMKNALDWVVGSGELYEKPVGIISAGTTGGPSARQVLARTLLWQGARLVAQLGISAPRTKSDASGEITDPATVAAIKALAHDIAAAMAASAAGRDAASIRVAASLGVRRDDDTAHIAPSARFER